MFALAATVGAGLVLPLALGQPVVAAFLAEMRQCSAEASLFLAVAAAASFVAEVVACVAAGRAVA